MVVSIVWRLTKRHHQVQVSSPRYCTHRDRRSGQGCLLMTSAEKALAMLVTHPYLSQESVITTPFPHTSSFDSYPQLLPLSTPGVPARYIHPHQHTQPVQPLAATAEAAISAQVPTPAELFDVCRQWGAVRVISVWVENSHLQDGLPVKWKGRVEFWYEDEAKRFEVGLGEMGMLVKGWQV